MAPLTPPTEPKSLSRILLACTLPIATAPRFANSRVFTLGRLTGLPMAGPYVSRRILPLQVHISGKSIPQAAIFIPFFPAGTPLTATGLLTAPITSLVPSKTTGKLSGQFESRPGCHGGSRCRCNSPSLLLPMPLLCPLATGARSTRSVRSLAESTWSTSIPSPTDLSLSCPAFPVEEVAFLRIASGCSTATGTNYGAVGPMAAIGGDSSKIPPSPTSIAHAGLRIPSTFCLKTQTGVPPALFILFPAMAAVPSCYFPPVPPRSGPIRRQTEKRSYSR